MPTKEECLAAGVLEKVRGNLRPHQMATRLLMATSDVATWMKTELTTLVTDDFVQADLAPKLQAVVFCNKFVAGEDFSTPLPHEMRGHPDGVWELRTADLRFFGWFPERNVFIIAAIDTAKKCKDLDLYKGYQTQVARIRGELNVCDGRYLTGDIDDCV